jgi:hypothetical protein
MMCHATLPDQHSSTAVLFGSVSPFPLCSNRKKILNFIDDDDMNFSLLLPSLTMTRRILSTTRPLVGGSTTHTRLLALIQCVLLFVAVNVDSFSVGSVGRPSLDPVGRCFRTPIGPFCQTRRTIFTTYAINNEEDHDEDDDDDDDDEEEDMIVDDAALGDWRKFRATLIDGGLPTANSGADTTTTTTTTTTTGMTTTTALYTTILPTEDGSSSTSSTIASSSMVDESSSPTLKKRRRTVAAQNEALLAQQNQPLAEEYRTGIWAHTIGQAEVGGLLCRMPVEAELYYHGTGYWKDKLDIMVQLEPASSPSPPEDSQAVAASSSSSSSSLGDKEQELNTNAKVEQ